MADQNFKIVMWDVADLIPYELNAKKHDADQVHKIATAISRHGWDVPIVVDKHGVIIKGHGRRLAAIELELKKVPVIVRADLTPDQVKAARLADNRVAMSDLDPELLRMALSEIEEDLSGIFDDKELEFMDADLGSMNTDAFVTDMAAIVADQKTDLDNRIAETEKARVPLSKAFGFKDVSGADQIVITDFMSMAETEGRTGAEAFIAHLKSLIALAKSPKAK